MKKRIRKIGSVEARVSPRRHKPALSQMDIYSIDRLIQEQPDITIHEIRKELQQQVSDETVHKAVLKLGYVYKRSLYMLRNRGVPDVRDKRAAWRKHIPDSGINNLIFPDESGLNINITKHYARSRPDERAVDSTLLNTPCNTTILSSIRLDGRTAHTIYLG